MKVGLVPSRILSGQILSGYEAELLDHVKFALYNETEPKRQDLVMAVNAQGDDDHKAKSELSDYEHVEREKFLETGYLVGVREGARLAALHISALLRDPVTTREAMFGLHATLHDDDGLDALLGRLALQYHPEPIEEEF